MSDAGLTDRNIMFMSDHKCEGSLKSYCRRPSTGQKQMISEVLGSIATGNSTSTSVNTSHCSPQNVVMNSQTQQVNTMTKMHGFATDSVFQNCSFHFK